MKKVLDIGLGCDNLRSVLLSALAGKFLIGWTGHQRVRTFTRSNASLSQFEPDPIDRETHVCFPSDRAVASRHCVHPKINGPLQDVSLGRSEAERARLGNGGQWASAERVNSGDSPTTLHTNCLFNPYLLSQDVRTDENSSKGAKPLKQYRRSLPGGRFL